MIGHDLGGRYEILSRVGGGGMALVYKAHDVLLNRNVAVKVLRQQFVHDDEFIRRFRREAQSAAALSHPNVVSIYDVGQEDETHYIVMEYVEGKNLNEIIQERAPLQTDEAVRIAMQICDALDHAHQNHIIHRDIKPHNILIGNNGRVKVTDFGIARAVTSSTITHTGSVVGSVHYFSPEHAKGINTGEKSDLYSLGIVIYQMLTGRLPFLGESPISVALKHLQETFEEPRIVNPHIPQSVENVILKAMRKKPSERYNTAHEMLLDLDTCLRPDRLNEPKITFDSFSDLEETKVMPAIRAEKPDQMDVTVERASEESSKDVKWKEEGLQKREGNWKKPLTVVGVTLLILALMIWGFIWLLGKLDVQEVEVPYVVGQTEAEARRLIEEKGLKVEMPIIYEFRKDIPKDQVFDHSKQNMFVKEGSFIQLYVSKGPELKEVPSYVGQSLQEATEALGVLGVTEKQIKYSEIHSEEAPNKILEQKPVAGEMIDPEAAEFTFVVSKGRETVKMEDLVDMNLKDARSLLKSLELVLKEEDILYKPSYLHDKDRVISIDNFDAGDMVPKGSEVSISVSSGPPADTKTYQFNIKISPAIAGTSSEVRITYSDARGENLDGGTRTINHQETIPVTVMLAPDTVAIVSVERDKRFIDSKMISYDQIGSGSHTSDLTIPGEDEAFVEETVQSEIDDSHDESGQEDDAGNPDDEQEPQPDE